MGMRIASGLWQDSGTTHLRRSCLQILQPKEIRKLLGTVIVESDGRGVEQGHTAGRDFPRIARRKIRLRRLCFTLDWTQLEEAQIC